MAIDDWILKRQRAALDERVKKEAKAKEVPVPKPEPPPAVLKPPPKGPAYHSLILRKTKRVHLATAKDEMRKRFTRTYCNAGIAPKKFVTLDRTEVTCEKCKERAGL